MEKLKLTELVEAVGGILLSAESNQKDQILSCASGKSPADLKFQQTQSSKGDPGAEILSVVTDSRKITKGCVFFALSGERFDGHAYHAFSL